MQVGTEIKSHTARRARGRPRAFDEDKVLASVLDVFWQKGYSGATLPDLAQAAGVTRPSLYIALGDKLSMYLKSLERYNGLLATQMASSLDPAKSLAEGLLSFYIAAIEFYFSGGKQPRGCLAFCTAPVEAVEEPAIKAALSETLGTLDAGFQARFRKAQQTGELQASTDVIHAAALASAVLHSLALRARTGQKKKRLQDFAAAATSILIGGL